MAIKQFFQYVWDGRREKKDLVSQSRVDVQNHHLHNWNHMFTVGFDGEKTAGEIGVIKNYIPLYRRLRLRSWQSFLESEITQIVMKRFRIWILGDSLKLQSEPAKNVLEQEGITLDVPNFTKTVESRFQVYSKSRFSTYSENGNLHSTANVAMKDAIIGGDVLVIFRFDGGKISCDLIDGEHIFTPFSGKDIKDAKNRGNVIKNGVEVDKKGRHIAYWVRDIEGKFQRIESRSVDRFKNQRVVATLIYGLQYRINDTRGMPLITAILETIKKLDRYKEATVGSAEERQKIAFSVEHEIGSTGENPILKNIQQSMNDGHGTQPETETGTQSGENAATKVAYTTGKTAFNMPLGASLKMLESKNELFFKEFYTTNIEIICAALEIPPEIALQKYDSNFSASRAALKDWEHTILVKRAEFSARFYQLFYNFWLEIEILNEKVDAPGYLKALVDNNFMVIEAYQNARFIGKNVPHIDPKKEVEAEREKLGPLGVNLPLTTAEKATEALNSGDYNSNKEQFEVEIEEAPKPEVIEPVPPASPVSPVEPNNT